MEKDSVLTGEGPAAEAVGTYRVGDYYDVGGRCGVVFEVWDDGRHGKIVSLDEAELQWAVDRDFDGVNPARMEIGAKDKADGAVNQREVESVANWREMYPAFRWCADHGEGWYLPAVDEIMSLLLNREVHDAVNATLRERGTKFMSMDRYPWYWSSTDSGHGYLKWLCAWYVLVNGGYSGSGNRHLEYAVRAVTTF